MRPAHALTQLLNSLALGVTLPVLSLILLARGARLETLGLLMGLYGMVTIAAELPTGIFADRWGRRGAFLLSCALNSISCLLLLLALQGSLVLLAAAMVFKGLGRAFSSGSLDALILEQTVAVRGQGYLPRVVSQLLVCQCAGIGLGALLCSALPGMGGYSWQLGVQGTLVLASLTLALCCIREQPRPAGERPTLRAQLAAYRRLAVQPALLSMLCCGVVGCVLLAGIESYWQPAFTQMAALNQPQRLLGVLAAAGFGLTTLGSWWAGRWRFDTSQPHRQWRLYLALLAGTGGCLLLLSWQRGPVGFAVCYLAFYLALGIANVPEQTLLNHYTPDSARASALSLFSLGGQLGGLGASLSASALLFAGLQIATLWQLGAAICLATCLLVVVKMGRP